MFEGVAERIVVDGRMASAALGRQLAAIHEMSLLAPQREFAAMELVCLLGLTRFAAEEQLRLATELCERLPEVLAALTDATLDLARARVFADVLSALDASVARRIAVAVLPVAPAKTTGELRALLRRKALAADPAFTKARRERAHETRAVQLHAADDGTASLGAFGLDSFRASAAFARIGALARARKTAGDDMPLEQLRADVFLELLEGQHSSVASGNVQLDVSLETLAGLDNDPGRLGAYGPVAADIARQCAEAHPGCQWQYAVRDVGGQLLQQGLTRARPTTPAGPRDRSSGPRRRSSTSQDAVRLTDRREGTGGSIPTAGSQAGPKLGYRDGSGSAHAVKQDGMCPDASGNDALVRAPGQDVSDRFANAALTRWIRLRDRTCRAPGCRRPAVSCQLDHTVRYSDGGPTHHANLCALCEFHHRGKDEGGWTVVQTRPGHFTWTSPLGRIYEVRPEPP